MRSLSLLALAALPAALAKTVTVCVLTGEASYSTLCKTTFGKTSQWVPVNTVTSSETSTITVHATVTTSEYVTVTPEPYVVNTTLTSTDYYTLTGPNVTDHFSYTTTLTTTEDTTISTTITSTTTISESTTVTTTTTTTPAGFVPVSDTIDTGNLDKKKRSPRPRSDSSLTGLAVVGNSSAVYPAEVNCGVQVYVTETRLVSATTAIDSTTYAWGVWSTEAATSTVEVTLTDAVPTITSTHTTTTTVSVPGASHYFNVTASYSETVTETNSITSTETETSSTTTTLTFTSTSTANGACQTNNVINSFVLEGTTYQPDDVFNNGFDEATTFSLVSSTDQFDCCNICTSTDGCTGTVYLGNGACALIEYGSGSSGQCIQSANIADVSYSEGSDGLYISNGLCGEFVANNPPLA